VEEVDLVRIYGIGIVQRIFSNAETTKSDMVK